MGGKKLKVRKTSKFMKKRRLKLKPAQRDSRRYFLVSASRSEVEKALRDYLGILGFAKANYVAVEKSGKFVGSCIRESLEDVKAGLALAGISVEKVSGTIKGLDRKS